MNDAIKFAGGLFKTQQNPASNTCWPQNLTAHIYDFLEWTSNCSTTYWVLSLTYSTRMFIAPKHTPFDRIGRRADSSIEAEHEMLIRNCVLQSRCFGTGLLHSSICCHLFLGQSLRVHLGTSRLVTSFYRRYGRIFQKRGLLFRNRPTLPASRRLSPRNIHHFQGPSRWSMA